MKRIIRILLLVAMVLATALVFHKLNIGPNIPESGVLGDTLVKSSEQNVQFWVFFTEPGRKIKLGRDLESIINNDRVMEVRFVQGPAELGQPKKLEQIAWKRGRGFSKIEV